MGISWLNLYSIKFIWFHSSNIQTFQPIIMLVPVHGDIIAVAGASGEEGLAGVHLNTVHTPLPVWGPEISV